MDSYQRADGTYSVDYDELISLLSQSLENICQAQITPSPRCIYKTPKLLREVNEAAYTPRLVSIGPSHFGNEDLEMMKNVKDRYLRNYLNRTQRTLPDIMRYTGGCKEGLKSYYAGEVTLHLPDTYFVAMILLDGVFIIELFLRMYYPDLVESGDVTLLQSTDLKNDLFFMLENQLPWFFIVELYNNVLIREPHRIPFLDLALSICSRHVPWYCPNVDMIRGLGVKHLHDLLRTTIIHPCPSYMKYPPLPSRAYCLPSAQQRLSATVLHEAGVKFKVRESESFLDIIFDKGALYMPSFMFDRNTETIVRNLMAYEQCHYHSSQTLLCDYFCLMDSLINTSKDVDLLVKNGIIINWLGDNDEVATLVNNLSKHVQIDVKRFYYAKLCEDLDRHCKIRWNNWKTTFKRDYLSTPWKVASIIAAIILLLLTFIQTVCSVLSFFI